MSQGSGTNNTPNFKLTKGLEFTGTPITTSGTLELNMVNQEQIKKAVYLQQPIATLIDRTATQYTYYTQLNGGINIYFKVPISDMGDGKFREQMEAKYLLRWLI